ncbi:hypothetical protein CAY57_01730 [Heyndrickxia coagulans]|nr:hypothetical protein CAY57_01730 [Heyndrickxia coagulans]
MPAAPLPKICSKIKAERAGLESGFVTFRLSFGWQMCNARWSFPCKVDERLFIFNRHCLEPLVANAAGKFLKAGRTMGLAGKHAPV